MRVRGEITKYKVLFQLVSQVVEYEYVSIFNSIFAELAIMASQEEGGKLEKLQVGRPIIMNGVMIALLR